MSLMTTGVSISTPAQSSGKGACALSIGWNVAGTSPGTLTVRFQGLQSDAGGTAIAAFCAADGSERVLAQASVTIEHHDGLEHLLAEGLVTATLRRESGRCELLYARTPLLVTLGVAGGRVDRPEIL